VSQSDETTGDSRPPGRIGRTRARVRTAVDSGQRRLQDYRTRYWLVDFLFGFTERDRDVAGSVISSALAFRFFLVLVPFIVVIVAVISAFTDLSSVSAESAVDALGVVGFAADAVAGASRMTGGQIWLSLILGLFALLWASHWTTTSLRTVHALAWGMTVRRWPRPFLASLVFMGFLVAFVMVAAGFNIGSGEEGWFFDVLGTLLSGAAMGGLWMVASWLLPHPEVGWRDLLPGAVLVAVGVQCLQIATFYFTWRIKGSSSLYGALGIAIVLLVWLYFASRLVVAAAMLNERVRFRRTGERAGHTLLGYAPADAPPDKTDAHRLLLADMAQGGNDMAEDQSQTPDQASGQADAGVDASEGSTAADGRNAPAGDAAAEAAAEAAAAAEDAARAAETARGTAAEADAAAAAARAADAAEKAVAAADRAAAAVGAEDMTTTVPASGGKGRRAHKVRRWTALALVCFAVLIWIVTAVALWSHSLLFNTDKYVATVAPVLKDPKVTKSMGQLIAKQTVKAVGLRELLEEELPPRVGFVAAPITSQVQDLLATQVTRLLRTERAYQGWETIQRFAHERLVAILRDESTVVKLEGAAVTLDLVPLIVAAIERLEDILPGVIANNAPLPRFDPEATIEEQRAELADYLGRPLSPDFGQIVLLEDDRVAAAQEAIKLFDTIVWVLLGVAIATVLAALVISPRRLRTLVQLGAGAVIVVVVARVAINQLQAAVVRNATGDAGTIIRSVVDTVFGSLEQAIIWLLIGGAIIGVLAYIASMPRWLVRAGRGTVDWSRRAWKVAAEQTSQQRSPTVDWIRANVDVLRIVIGVAAVAILLFGSPGWAWALVIVIVAVGLIGGLTWMDRRPPADAGKAAS